MFENIAKKYKARGLSGIVEAINRRLFPKQIKFYDVVKGVVSNGSGFEIGGTSFIFTDSGQIPLYKHINHLDNCNFSGNTVWEGEINKNYEYKYHKSKNVGTQYILEATNLKGIDDGKYDFLLSSHMIEHTANPIKALKEWLRVIKVDGHMVLVIPHKDGTFDHRRPTTTIDHLIDDFENNMDEYDLSHLEEILNLHDLKLDPDAGTYDDFKKRSQVNHENRCLHHHVFTAKLAVELMDYLKVNIKTIESIAPSHILVVVQKVKENIVFDNSNIISYVNSSNFNSPFISDQSS